VTDNTLRFLLGALQVHVSEFFAWDELHGKYPLLVGRQQEQSILRSVTPMATKLVTLVEVGVVGEAQQGEKYYETVAR
jgi:hypothetical protein